LGIQHSLHVYDAGRTFGQSGNAKTVNGHWPGISFWWSARLELRLPLDTVPVLAHMLARDGWKVLI
jgi:hypothetical protein